MPLKRKLDANNGAHNQCFSTLNAYSHFRLGSNESDKE